MNSGLEGKTILITGAAPGSEKRRQLNLQRQFGGVMGDVGGPPAKKEHNILLEPAFPIGELIEQVAGHRGVPADRLKRKFQAQLEQAYVELVETGTEGRLPDFGVLRYADGRGLTDIEFDFNREIQALFGGREGR